MRKMVVLLVAVMMLVGTFNVLAQTAEIDIFISMPEYADPINELIDTYQEEVNNEVEINYETTQSDYPTLLKVKLNSGDIPDLFASTSGKEIELYKEYSYDLSGEPMMDTMLPSVKKAMADADGNGVYGFAIKGNYFGLIYNKDLFAQAGIEKFPETISEMETAIEKLEAEGITPFTSGFSEWWVFKHLFQHFLVAAEDDVQALVRDFENGEASFSDYPVLEDNFFHFVDLVVEHGDNKILESSLNTEISQFATGQAAMVIGQGPWIEDSLIQIDPELNIGFTGYPVSEDPAESQVISGADQAVRVSSDSEDLDAVLDFVNWWYTSDYGKSWFTDVAGVVPPIEVEIPEDYYQIIQEGIKASEEKGSAPLAIIYSTDSFHSAFGEAMQTYVGGNATKAETIETIETKWQEIDGSN
ncbi:raffinose/stachyose/melibiose transport system substrate-binding protein [Halanaerobium saccharolyticum]|uniref:Raffinose/stachyose/melibiose transport system substrate-binding protein n=1 Tax=Halanaerobium saccharolyticum TaxID=43595 RepID=A0A4R7Z7B5_9FIRM|nr:extracellular solute-binding protein [Halanaerobium saccharolyticum]RAK12667.1 raffinose/stachyose/melibiose transport system substrate-binding protein [Halanaerobium saccharolyticum]TDW05421.1 raffinose/stachyose/melibiose transport system substrate-binding protein [Halanaerobium saccharolyticum]TDX62936.1 raffinose/stachyose/melibiose transport system substrate-binding protein [Halanaerobium saccharolyticum]